MQKKFKKCTIFNFYKNTMTVLREESNNPFSSPLNLKVTSSK